MSNYIKLTKKQCEEITIDTLTADHEKIRKELFDLRAKLIEEKIVPGDNEEFMRLTNLVDAFYLVYGFYWQEP